MSFIPDLAAVLNSALLPTTPRGMSYSSGVRNAMVFTSLLRTRIQNLASFSGQDATPPNFPHAAVADVIMPLNPNTIRFKQGKRWTKKDTREGSVFFHFTNAQGENNDILSIEFAGNTGLIDRRGSLTTAGEEAEVGSPTGTGIASPDDTGALQKILAWHNLYLLTREPMLLPDMTENVFTITYTSALFPLAVDFNGFYNQVLEFEELALKPNSRGYKFEFTVTSVDPPMETVLDAVFAQMQSSILQPSSTGLILGPNVRVISP
jgi:hypothetical protein